MCGPISSTMQGLCGCIATWPGPSEGEACMLAKVVLEQFVDGLPGKQRFDAYHALGHQSREKTAFCSACLEPLTLSSVTCTR